MNITTWRYLWQKRLWLIVALSLVIVGTGCGSRSTVMGSFPAIPQGQPISLASFSDLPDPYKLFALQAISVGSQTRLLFATELRQYPYSDAFSTIDSLTVADRQASHFGFSGHCWQNVSLTADGIHQVCTDNHSILSIGPGGTDQVAGDDQTILFSVALTPDGTLLATLSRKGDTDFLTISDITFSPLALRPRFQMLLPMGTTSTITPSMTWSPDGQWLMLHGYQHLLFFKHSALVALFAPVGQTPPMAPFDPSLPTTLPAGSGVNSDIDLIEWGVAPDEITVTDDAHLLVSTLDFTRSTGVPQQLNLSHLEGSVMIHQIAWSADGRHLYCVIGFPYYGFNDANPTPFNPSDRLYEFSLA